MNQKDNQKLSNVSKSNTVNYYILLYDYVIGKKPHFKG